MKRFLASESVDLFEQDEQRRKTPRQDNVAVNVGLTVTVNFGPAPLVLAPAPAPAPAPPTATHDDLSDAEDEDSIPRRRSNSYGATALSKGDKSTILDLLSRPEMTCVDVLEHLQHYHDRFSKFVNLRTLQKWKAKLGKPELEKKQPGPKPVLSEPHRSAMAQMLKELGEGGSPMNWRIARPILMGYLKDANLEHILAETSTKGKVTLSPTFINDLFLEYRLAVRSQTTDAQSLPAVLLSFPFPLISSIHSLFGLGDEAPIL